MDVSAPERNAGLQGRHGRALDGPANGPIVHRCLAWADDPSLCYEAEGLATRYRIRLATSHGQRSDASFLVRKLYRWRGYSTDVAHDAPTGVTLVACDEGRIIATVSVGFDSPKNLAVQSLYPEEVAQLRAQGARLCEFTRLAVDRNGSSLEVLAMLFHIAFLYAVHVHGATHLLAEVNPRHVRFYLRMLGFSIAGPERICRRVGAPAVLISLALDHAEGQIARYGGQRNLAKSMRSLYPYFFSPREAQGIARRFFGADLADAPAPAAAHA